MCAMQWVVDNLFTEAFWIWYNRKLHIDIRDRVIRKKAREAKAAKQE
jgi:17beta-estradiol 17-dehydrogenase / very-long-chain 3-oxoacyl-CoA reductase